jgi:hypothetical protein
VLRWWAHTLVVLLGAQVVLGFGAYVARFTGWAVPGDGATVIGLPVAHRAVGALVLGAAVALALQLWRRRAARIPKRVDVRLASSGVTA